MEYSRRRFFIFSLPRSGSAWLSVFLTSRDSYCYHEPLADGADLVSRFDGRPEPIVGAVDTGAYVDAPAVLRALDSTALFVLTRDPGAIAKSSAKLGISYPAHMEAARLPVNLPRIHYEHLFELGYLRELWARIIDTPFDEERAQQLLEMNVQRDVGRFFLERPHLRENRTA